MSEDNRSVVETDLVDLSTLPEDADLVGIRCGVIFPITNELWKGKVIRNDGNRQFGWVSDNNKLACVIAYDQGFKVWAASLFMNLEGLSKVDFN